MGNSTSKTSAMPRKEAGMTADSIEQYYDSIAKYRAACANADDDDAAKQSEGDNSSDTVSDAADTDRDDNTPTIPSNEILRDTGIAPEASARAVVHFNAALRALNEQEKDKFDHAVDELMKLGVKLDVLAKKALNWVKDYPWETAAIVIPLILVACTPAILGAVGFGAGGVVAGSIAAGIQAGIGNVVVGSAFAVLTSAAMGGGGATIFFGCAWAVPTAVLGAIALWKRRQGGNDGNPDYDGFQGGDDNDGGRGDNNKEGGKVKLE